MKYSQVALLVCFGGVTLAASLPQQSQIQAAVTDKVAPPAAVGPSPGSKQSVERSLEDELDARSFGSINPMNHLGNILRISGRDIDELDARQTNPFQQIGAMLQSGRVPRGFWPGRQPSKAASAIGRIAGREFPPIHALDPQHWKLKAAARDIPLGYLKSKAGAAAFGRIAGREFPPIHALDPQHWKLKAATRDIVQPYNNPKYAAAGLVGRDFLDFEDDLF